MGVCVADDEDDTHPFSLDMGAYLYTTILLLSALSLSLSRYACADIRYFDFVVQYANYTRLCNGTKTMITVNGEYPGPTQYVREGDTVIVNVTNLVADNVTIHWHGVRQYLSSWADGVAYITQCPVQTGKSFVHTFNIVEQRGTLLWHAHISWLRATLHGAFIMLPKKGIDYPFKPVHSTEMIMILGEWWNADYEQVLQTALLEGAGYELPNALTINGQPGLLYDCSKPDTQVYNVTKGNTYMFRIVNAAVNFQMFVSVANHTLTVVEGDAEYMEPYTTDVVVITPGQTTNVLLTADQCVGQYIIAASIYSPAPQNFVPFPDRPTTAILRYEGALASIEAAEEHPLPTFPAFNDTNYAFRFFSNQTRLAYSKGYYYYDIFDVPDVDMLIPIGYNLVPCYPNRTCVGPNGDRIRASMGNISLELPTISILEAYYNEINGVFDSDFPDQPPYPYNYTGVNLDNKRPILGAKVKVLEFASNVQVVLQNNANLFFETHPIHLHGQNFYIVGAGVGTYNPETDPANFNLVNPPSRNTVAVPYGGWVAIRFKAINPGVWFMHCHFDIHYAWGMGMTFIVKNGQNVTLPPLPRDLPTC